MPIVRRGVFDATSNTGADEVGGGLCADNIVMPLTNVRTATKRVILRSWSPQAYCRSLATTKLRNTGFREPLPRRFTEYS
jgi:hypothetical protein